MTRPGRIVLISAGSMVLLLLIVVVAGVTILRSDWFQNKVRLRLISEVEKATGGTVEIGAFRFDWKTMTAEIDRFVVHGTEPASGPPLLMVPKLAVGLKIVSILKRDVDVRLVRADGPQAFLLVNKDGSTNIPEPKIPRATNKSGAETILELAVGQFEINKGRAEVHAAGNPPKVTPFQLRGENLRTFFTYDMTGPRYSGTISAQPIEIAFGDYRPLPVNVDTKVQFEKDRLVVQQGHLTTPHSELNLDGKIEHFSAPVLDAQYRGRFDLGELSQTFRVKGKTSGQAESEGKLHYVSDTDYGAEGSLKLQDVAITQPGMHLRGVHGDANFVANPTLVDLKGMRLYAAGGEITGSGSLRDADRFALSGHLRGFDLNRTGAQFGVAKLPYDGVVSGPFQVEGSLKQMAHNHYSANARLEISPAKGAKPVRGAIDVHYDAAADNLALKPSFVQLPSTRLTFSGALNRQLTVHAETTDLSDLAPVLGPKTPMKLANGKLLFDGTVNGKLTAPVVQGHFAGTNVMYEDQKLDSAAADIRVQRSGLEIHNGVFGYQNLSGKLDAVVGLTNWKPLDSNTLQVNAALANADLANLLALAGHKEIAATGTLQASARITGTIGNPQPVADLTVTQGSLQGEPFDRLAVHVDSPTSTSERAVAQLTAGPKQLNGTANYTHGTGVFLPGDLTFTLNTNSMQLAQFKTLHASQPSLVGSTQISAQGAVRLLASKPNQPSYQIQNLNADIAAKGLSFDQRRLGDLTLTARTTGTPQGPALTAHVDSNFASAVLKGDARVLLSGDYPGSGDVTFSKVDVSTVRKILAPSPDPNAYPITGSVEGKLTFSGSAMKRDSWKAALEIPKLELRPANPADPVLTQFALTNSAPIRVTLQNNKVTIESARLVSRDTDLSISGSVLLDAKNTLDLHVDGKADLSVLHVFERDIYSSGAVALQATIRGNAQLPTIGGYLDLKNANLNLVDAPNGLSNANGRIVFDGNRANIQSLTAETGGGKVKMTGFVAFAGGTYTFRLAADAQGVRIRYPEGVSTIADAALNVTGSKDRSVLTGRITILRTAFNPRTDVGSILTASSQPVKTPSAQTGILGGLQFDVGIETSPDISFQSSLTDSLQFEANLRLRGTASNPVLLGRINITQGDLTFFGNKYTINSGSIAFYNPVKLEPILNVDLETKARGVDVTLTVSGPINKLNVSYHSDPPLQFSDIVALLATGRTPADATIAARQPAAAPQSWQQMGASALVGQAIANPVAGRLQRFFGVSKLKIDPQLSGVTGNPQARLTIEQQVTPAITFTYITDVANASTQVLRVEWAINKNVSAVALREENGYFGLDLFYKKRFK